MRRFSSLAPLAAAAALCLGTLATGSGAARAPSAPAKAPQRNLALEEANRALVLKFSEVVFNQGDFEFARKVLSEGYIQHNPRFATGREAFIAAFKGVLATHPGLHSRIVRSATDGDLVFTHVQVTDPAARSQMAIVNIFRVEKGMIVEHWDVVQPVPETAANTNTMF